MDMKQPILYGSNQILVDQDLTYIGKRYAEKPRMDLLQLITSNKVSGCTMVMNKELRNIIVADRYTPSDDTLRLKLHDSWCMIVATICGKVVYDDDAFILYRQHSNNVVGARKMSAREKCADKIRRFRTQKYKGYRSRLSREILDKFDLKLQREDILNLETISDCNSLRGGIALCKNTKVRCTFNECTGELILKCLCGWI